MIFSNIVTAQFSASLKSNSSGCVKSEMDSKRLRFFSSGPISSEQKQGSNWTFCFESLKTADVFKLFASKDKAKIDEANSHVLKCAQINFERNFGVPLNLPNDTFFKTVAQTKEGQRYLKSYRSAYSFFMSTHETFLGLNLSPDEIASITKVMEQGNAIKTEVARQADITAKRHAEERIALYKPLLNFVRDKAPYYAVTFVNASHITVKQHIILRNIIDPDIRAVREREFVVELKNKIIEKVKLGILTESEISDLFG